MQDTAAGVGWAGPRAQKWESAIIQEIATLASKNNGKTATHERSDGIKLCLKVCTHPLQKEIFNST
jgi:hypothetical protein